MKSSQNTVNCQGDRMRRDKLSFLPPSATHTVTKSNNVLAIGKPVTGMQTYTYPCSWYVYLSSILLASMCYKNNRL